MGFVPEPRRIQVIWLAIVGALGVVVLGSAFLPMEAQVSGYCLLEPARAWTLSERQVGSYESRLEDRVSGRILGSRVHQFSRSTVLELGLGGGAPVPDRVLAGQIVAQLQASDLELEFAERRTALEEARGHLATLQAGAKPSALRHAQLKRERAAAELGAYAPHFERGQALHAGGDISAEAWEAIRSQRGLLQLDLALAAAELEMLESGDSPAAIAAATETLHAIEAELATAAAMRSSLAIRTPIDGILRMNPEAGVLLRVAAVDSFVVSVLLPQRCAEELLPGQPLHAHVPGLGDELFAGVLLRVEQEVIATERGPYIRAVGLLPDAAGRLEAGMQGRARIAVGRSTALARARRGFQAALFRELGP